MMQKNSFNIISCLIIIAMLISGSTFAAFLKNVPVKINQPDGTALNVFASGDEYYYRMHDAENYTITRDPLTGYYVYASILNDELVPTDYVLGEIDPHLTELQAGICISSTKWAQLRHDFWENTPAKTPNGINNLGPLSSGTINNVVVYIRFSDQPEFTNNVAYYDAMFNNTAPSANSMYNYYKDVSYNTLFINSSYFPSPSGTVIVSYQDPHERNYYVPFDTLTNPTGYHSNERTSREHALLTAAINAIASQVPVGLNIDHDNDGYVDNVCFIIKGGTTAWSTLLWPHRWALYSTSAYINSKQVWDYNFQLDDFLTGSANGVLCHEMFHTLGAPDLYHYAGDGMSPVGSWDIMENNANPPQSMGAYMKYQYGNWISSIPAITSSGTYTLNPITSSTNNCYKLYSPNSTTEFFVFEFRKKTGTFENSIPGSGLLIYRINTTVGAGNAGGPPDEVYVYRPGGSPSSNGSVSMANFSTETGRVELNNSTNPYAFFTDGSLANIDISNVTSSAGGTISFTVNVGTAANFTANKTNTCPASTVVFTDQSIGLPSSWLWTFTPNSVTYVDGTSAASQNPHVQFNGTGQYTVALTANGPGGSNTKTKTNFITILNLQALPFADDFESNLFTTNNWTIENPDNAITWALATVGGNTPGTKAASLNFYDYGSQGQHDNLISPPINLSGSTNPKLTFKVAYRQYNSDYHDSLKIMLYSDCGETYISTPYSKTASVLATGAATTNSFTPSLASDWRTDTVSLSGLSGNVIIKFLAINDYGNNLYIDNINVSGLAYVTLSGSVTYLNTANTHLDSTNIVLKQGDATIQQTSTDGAGNYSFSNVAPGTYSLVSSSTKKWGGVNSTDALLIMKHFVGMSTLTGLKMKAGSADLNPAINSIDALMVQKRSVSLITSFPVGDWTFTVPTVVIQNPVPYTQNINGLCVGDVNGSYIPATKTEPSVELMRAGEIVASSVGAVAIPFTVSEALSIGAVSLSIEYPETYKILNVNIPQGQKDNLEWRLDKNHILISWYNINPMNLKAGDVLLELIVMPASASPQASDFILTMDASSELADQDAVTLNNVQILYPKLINSIENLTIDCGNYPNPFSNTTTIWFNTHENGNVTISLYTVDGTLIRTIYDEYTTSGEHRILWDGKDINGVNLPSGVYYYHLLLNKNQLTRKILQMHN